MDTTAKYNNVLVYVHHVSDTKLFAIVSYQGLDEFKFKVNIADLTEHSAELQAKLKGE